MTDSHNTDQGNSGKDHIRFSHALLILRHWRKSDTTHVERHRSSKYFASLLGCLLSLLIVTGHYYWAAQSDCIVNFQRGGSALVLLSAVLFAWVEWHRPHGELFSEFRARRPTWRSPYITLPLIAVFGTLIWGYGDLLPWVSKFGCS